MGKVPDAPRRQDPIVPDGYTADPRNRDLFDRAQKLASEKGISFAAAVDLAANQGA